MGSLEGRIAVVTGAGRGIGRSHALALAGAGATLVVNDVGVTTAGEGYDQAPASLVAEEIKSFGGEAAANFDDIADYRGAQRLIGQAVETYGRLDILINNAGILRDRMLVNMTEEEWDGVVNVHLKGHFAPLRHAAAHWRERSKAGEQVRARVVNTSSPSGLFGNVGQTNYGAAKAGIAALTMIAALELQRYGVTVNAIAPNARTRMTEQAFGDLSSPTKEFDAMDPANISPVIVALCSDEAQDITGQCLFVYGGLVNLLQPWQPGTVIKKDGRWEAAEFLARLRAELPEGAAPEGMIPTMIRANEGRSVQIG
jgi:NAD(P)-dependent dehydrogenase (short-subunit alcohol dehydrogenase family)